MFDNLFRFAGGMWAVVPLAAAMFAFGAFVVGFDAQALRKLGRRA